MKISLCNKNKKIKEIETGECFCFDCSNFYMKTDKGFYVCLNNGQTFHFDEDAFVIPIDVIAEVSPKIF